MNTHFKRFLPLILLLATLISAGCTVEDKDDPEILVPEPSVSVYDKIKRGVWFCAYDAQGTVTSTDGEERTVEYAHVVDVYRFTDKKSGFFQRFYLSDDKKPQVLMRSGDQATGKFSFVTSSFNQTVQIRFENDLSAQCPRTQTLTISGTAIRTLGTGNQTISLHDGGNNAFQLFEWWNYTIDNNVTDTNDQDYFNEFKTDDDNHDWMAQLDDNRLVADLSIPGAHEAATAEGWTGFTSWGFGRFNMGNCVARTQDLTIDELWKVGVRAFDISLQLDESQFLRCSNGDYLTDIRINDFFEALIRLLKDSPSEFAIVEIANPSGTDEQVRKWSVKLNEIMHSDVYAGYFSPFDARITVGQMRGKILVFSRQKYNDVPVGAFCQNWSNSHLMEEQQAGSIINAKWIKSPLWVQQEWLSGEFFHNAVQDMMKAAVGRDMSADLPAWVFNFVSFKVTGDRSNDIRAYAEMRNIKAFNFLNNEYNIGPVGIVLMDFAGVDNTRDFYGQTCYASNGMQLVNALIRQNFKQ